MSDITHELLPDGESTEKWAIRQQGFLGSIKQLTHCARCGDLLPFKGKDAPLRVRDILKPTIHILCDECFEALPE